MITLYNHMIIPLYRKILDMFDITLILSKNFAKVCNILDTQSEDVYRELFDMTK